MGASLHERWDTHGDSATTRCARRASLPPMGIAVPFPSSSPAGYEWLDDEPPFDPAVHLYLEMPATVTTLGELGYSQDDIAAKPTDFAVSSAFRVLSDEGAEVMLSVARRLRRFTKPAGDRIDNTVRGGCYRSKWLRDLSIDPSLTAHLSSIYGLAVAPHPMPLHLGHLNYDPAKVDVSIDKWHHDTLPLDFVLAVTDPASVDGGRFEYFVGTKDEAAALAAEGLTPPPDRVVAPDMPGPGWAIALHGNMVVHRAGPLFALGERITMVNGYVALDTSYDMQSRTADLITVDDPEVLWTEWAKYAAWRAQSRLSTLIAEFDFTPDRDAAVAALEHAIGDVRDAVDQMRAGPIVQAHYGG
jgi:hypothetical protein